jgi:non-ribosomal peptide synthase protein (TIGR01720 family)
LLGGEALTADCIKEVSACAHAIFDEYGPTEATVGAMLSQVFPPRDTGIGKAYPNVKLYNLNSALQAVPIGAPGELYIGGAGLARGYLNRPELTAERFIDNPFATPEDIGLGYTRLYKTGDLVRWLADGNLEYLGRNDFQVKIRGHRIELGEIESALNRVPEIQQAVVIDRERENGKYLVAYIAVQAEASVAQDELRNTLLAQLPEYMVPSVFITLESIPLTINGKVDRRALPEPDWVDKDNYTAPRTALESQLCTIWQEMLGLPRIGIHDNFFRSGGDSIISIQLVSRMRREGLAAQVKDIFNAPTIAQLALVCSAKQQQHAPVAEQGLLTGDFTLLPIQRRFFQQSMPSPHHYNQSFLLRVPGDLNVQAIEQSLAALSAQHDMLRCSFEPADTGYRQRYHAGASAWMAPLQTLDVAALDKQAVQRQLTHWQSGFSFESGPLWQAAYLTGYADGSGRLFFAFHHLIIDAVSWRIIAEDMQRLLSGQPLDGKTSSYRQWVEAVQSYTETHRHEVEYWHGILQQQRTWPAPAVQQTAYIQLAAAQTQQLLQQANKGYHTEINDLLLSALSLALHSTFKQAINHITLEGHGREAIDAGLDVSHTVGWFTTVYPVRLQAHAEIGETIIAVKENLRRIPNKGIGFGALQQAGYIDAACLPCIGFNYLGQFENPSKPATAGLWRIVGEMSGQQISAQNHQPLLLNINGLVQDGCLKFVILSGLSKQDTATFSAALQQALEEVTDYCVAMAASGGVKTASDYGVDHLSMENLERLKKRFAQVPATTEETASPQPNKLRI